MRPVIDGVLDGTYDYGNCGIVPLVRVDIEKPKLRNNGYNCYTGHPRLRVPGLAAVLPGEGQSIRQGHVMIFYRCGGSFGTFLGTNLGNDLFDPS